MKKIHSSDNERRSRSVAINGQGVVIGPPFVSLGGAPNWLRDIGWRLSKHGENRYRPHKRKKGNEDDQEADENP